MAWTIRYTDEALKSLNKLDYQLRKGVREYMKNHIATLDSPHQMGHALVGNLSGSWVYTFRKDYRIICEIQNLEVTILVVEVGHRSDVYKRIA